jgi:phosphoserine phosphatase RsbU/P
MATISDDFVSGQLHQRRARLEQAIATLGENADLLRLLEEVDSALARLGQGTYGLCETCHEPIEQERLLADPLIRFCLDHLTSVQQRALEEDLELAAQIQRALLPKQNLALNGWQVYHHYEPAGLVSGDYCDLVSADGGSDLFFFLGDVAGKGIAASMLMAHLHAIFRSLLAVGLPVNQLAERANRVFCESTLAGHYATLVSGKAGADGEVELCNAGHCPPFLVRAGNVTRIESTSLPIGLFCEGRYPLTKLNLAKGDSLFLYTDGLIEARNRSNNEYGYDRVSRLLGNQRDAAPQEFAGACLEDLGAFLAGSQKTDDLTIMVIQRIV